MAVKVLTDWDLLLKVSRNWSKINCERILHIAVVCVYKIGTLFAQSAMKDKSDVIT